MDFTLATYNVHSCIGLDGHCKPERVAQVLAGCRADIIALQEVDVGRRRSGQVNQHETVAELLQMRSCFYAAFSYEDEEYGGALLSRLPMELVKTGPLPGREGLEPRGALWAKIEVHGRVLNLITTHLGLRPFERSAQVRALLGKDWLGHADFAAPSILCGDFNFAPISTLHRKISRSHRSVRQLVRRPFSYGTFMGILALDHIFASRGLHVAGLEVPRDGVAKVASDHRPLIAQFSFTGDT